MANLLSRIGFIDETSLKTNMAKTTGWSAKGARLTCHAPFGHWNTQTFIAALRPDRLEAPWVIEGPMNREMFELYVETRLAPTLQPGDAVRGLTPRQSVIPQKSQGRSSHARRGCMVLVPAAIQPRSEPDRDGLRKAQGSCPKSRCTDIRRPLARRRSRL
jgi:hypothetical protein